VPDVAHPGMLVMVHELETVDELGLPVVQITALNMTSEPLDGTVRSESLPLRAAVTDATDGAEIGSVDDLSSFPLHIEPYGARFLLLHRSTQ